MLFKYVSVCLTSSSLITILVVIVDKLYSFAAATCLNFKLLLLPLLCGTFCGDGAEVLGFLFLAVNMLYVLKDSLIFIGVVSGGVTAFSKKVRLLSFLSNLGTFVSGPVFNRNIGSCQTT